MEINILKEVIIIFALSILVIFVFNKFKLPSIIGFLFTGLITGPHGLKLITNVHDVEILAEIGIVLLLFTIGIEFSIKRLIQTKRNVLFGGALQVGLIILATTFIALFIGSSWNESVFIGFLISLSSTAIVMRIFQNKGELRTFHGQTTLSILIFQDMIIIPMILFTPLLAGESESSGGSVFLIAAKGIGFILFTVFAAKFIVPKVLHQIARTQNRELFLLTIIVIGFATAWLSSSIGLSLALGAFIAGLIISESEFSEQAIGNIIPFRDLFISFFFVSVGMLLNLEFVLQHPGMVILISLGVLLLKSVLSGFVAFVLGYPFKTTLIVGLALSQVGEFSFVLSEFGKEYGLLSEFNYQMFLAAAVLTLSLTPFIINRAPGLAEYILKRPVPVWLRQGLLKFQEVPEMKMRGHLIIIGFGINGKNVARAAKYAKISHIIIEMNPDTVKSEHAKGEIIHYGDATQESILELANIRDASILVVTIPNTADAKLITQRARQMNPGIHIIIRTRFVQDIQYLLKLGANEVIPEEFETSVEIFSRVLNRYMVPKAEIEKLISHIRSGEYGLFRDKSYGLHQLQGSIITPTPGIKTLLVLEDSELIGKTIEDCMFSKYRLALIAVYRDGVFNYNVLGNQQLQANDVLYFTGSPEDLSNLNSFLQGKMRQSNMV